MNPSRQQARPWTGARPTPVSAQTRTTPRRPDPGTSRKQSRAKKRVLTGLQRTVGRIALGLAVATGVLFASLDVTTDLEQPNADSQWARSAGARSIWMVDVDGDGMADFANPTRTYLRDHDIYGSGSFLAGRDHARRKHLGSDFVATPGDPVRAPISGIVTLVGAAYGNDPYLRFIEIVDNERQLNVRLFYVQPGVAVGKHLKAGDIVGAAQSLDRRYPLITNHVHVEMRDAKGRFLDPALVLPPARPTAETFAAAIPKPARRAARPAPRRATGTIPDVAVAEQATAAAASATTQTAAASAQVTPVAAPRASAPASIPAAAAPATTPAPGPAAQSPERASARPPPDRESTPTA